MKMHYSGGLVIRKGDRVSTYAAGYPVCCFHLAAYAIRERGNQTNASNMVTCKKCLRMLAESAQQQKGDEREG